MASSTIKKIVPDSVGAVAKSGDTMTGVLNVLDDIYAGSSTFTGQLNIVAKSDKGEYMLYSNGSTQSNTGAKGLYVKNSEGTGTSVILTDDSNNSTFYGNATGTAANVTGIVAIDHGGTNATTPAAARANLEITPANIGAHPAATTLAVVNNTNYTGTPSDSISKPMTQIKDTNNFIRHQTYGIYTTNGTSYTYLSVRKPGTNGGDPVANEIAVGFDANGNKTYSITDPATFRNTLGATSGLWPVTLGGTGATTPATARTNLEITPANIGAKSTQTAVSSPSASGSASAFIDTISQNTQGVITVTKKNVTPASIGALALSGGTMTGDLIISHAANETMTANSTNPKITFSENGSQPVHLIYSDYDNYRSPAGLKVIGGASASPAWFEVEGQIYTSGGTFKNIATSSNTLLYIQTNKNNGGVELRADSEGGNLKLINSNNTIFYEADVNGDNFRIYSYKDCSNSTNIAYLLWSRLDGGLTLRGGDNSNYATTISTDDVKGILNYHDTAGTQRFRIYSTKETNGTYRTYFMTGNTTTGYNQIGIGIKTDGTRVYSIADQAAFRNAIGASSGAWPISIGGTGATTAEAARKNLNAVKSLKFHSLGTEQTILSDLLALSEKDAAVTSISTTGFQILTKQTNRSGSGTFMVSRHSGNAANEFQFFGVCGNACYSWKNTITTASNGTHSCTVSEFRSAALTTVS